jgi:alkylation response protein AidB-like acyl-CoA dehydrogenase
MDFELTDDQVALQEGVRAFLDGRFSLDDVRAIEAAGHLDRDRWRELGDTGVFSLTLPEADGGLELGVSEAALVFEELGRALVPGPLVATFLAAPWIDGAATG